MSGVLRISTQPRSVWLPQGWIFDAALDALANVINDPQLARKLETACVEQGGGYMDLTGLPPTPFRTIADAARTAIEATVADGPRPGAEPSSLARQVWGQSLLAGLLALDPRADDADGVEGRFVISENNIWRGPAAAHCLVLEHLAASLRFNDQEAAMQLLAARDTGMANISRLDAKAYQRMLPAVKWMTMRYAPNQVLEADSEPLMQIWPTVAELAQRMAADPRAEA